MKKAQLPTCEVSELGFFKVCEFYKITSGVQALIDLQLCIINVMSPCFGIGSIRWHHEVIYDCCYTSSRTSNTATRFEISISSFKITLSLRNFFNSSTDIDLPFTSTDAYFLTQFRIESADGPYSLNNSSGRQPALTIYTMEFLKYSS